MHNDANETATNPMPLVLESDQNNDRFLRTGVDFATLRLLSSKCQESRTQSLPNQDYARLVVDSEERSLVFSVCDGVGSSYMGGFAANYLGRHLVGWLQSLRTIQFQPHEIASLSQSLSTSLAGWAITGQAELSRLRVSPAPSPLVQEVLEELRTSHGGETVFCAGRIECAGGRRSQGNPPLDGLDSRVHILLCWMGNVKVAVFQNDRDEVNTGYMADEHAAWSTARGVCGTPHLFIATLDSLHRVIVHTDGANRFGQSIAELGDQQLRDLVLDQLHLPTNDDVTVLDVQWRIDASMLSNH